MGTLRKKSIKNDLAKEQHDNRAMSRAMPASSSSLRGAVLLGKAGHPKSKAT